MWPRIVSTKLINLLNESMYISGQNADMCRFLILKGANVAQIDKIGEVILQTILKHTPRAMPTILERCDAGIVMENEKIELDFQKAFGSSKGGEKNQKEHDMVLLQTLSLSPFQEYVEHPLLEAFVRHKFDRVKAFFWIVTLLPTILFAGTIISLHMIIFILLSFRDL